ncbi:hypothetical protein ACS0TY_003524 [Phlomoides rotata]
MLPKKKKTEKLERLLLKCSARSPVVMVEFGEEESDATECSSSFDDSDFDGESDVNSDGGGVCNTNTNTNTRRKLSCDWRSFIRPVMWRCKWIEVQMNKLEAQHKEYGRKLEECKNTLLQVLDHILEMIKGLHSRVVEMKSRVGKLTCQHSSSSSSTSMASYFASQLLSAAAAAAEEYDDDDILIDNHLVRDEMPCLKLEEQGKKKMLLLLHTDEEEEED